MFSARPLHHVVADERIEIVRYVILKRVGYAVRAAAGIGIGIGSRQTQAFGLVLGLFYSGKCLPQLPLF